jgi:hypothetical protein
VTVIVDRREGGDRRNRQGAPPVDDRRSPNQFRDRRRERLPGTFPETDAPDTD